MSYTILEYLNEDCWREVLQYMTYQEIIKTESVSRKWQNVVLNYLQGVRIGVITRKRFTSDISQPQCSHLRLLSHSIQESKSFGRWSVKLGSSVVAAYADNILVLEALVENCPNIQTLFIENLDLDYTAQYNLDENFKCLQYLSITKAKLNREHCVSKFMGDRALTEIEFRNVELTGECLTKINTTNLRSLKLNFCLKLQSTYLLSMMDRLSKLKMLKVNGIPENTVRYIYLGLDKMPNLEMLGINDFCNMDSLYTAQLCGLPRLKTLSINLPVRDADVEALTQSLKELRCLELGRCGGVTMEGGLKKIVCNLGSQLTELRLTYLADLDDDGLLDIIRGCPELELLEIAHGGELQLSTLARAAAVRSAVRPGRRLLLDVIWTNLAKDYFHYYMTNPQEHKQVIKTEFEDLTVNFFNNILNKYNHPSGLKLTDLADPLKRMKAVEIEEELRRFWCDKSHKNKENWC